MDYLKGILFLILYINTFRVIGKKFFKSSSFFSHIIFGYLVYYFVQFFLGFLFQAALLPLQYYYYLTGIVLAVINGYSIYEFMKEKVDRKAIMQHLKDYYLVYLFSFVLLFLSIIYAPGHWLGNNLDDGYYVMKIINFVDCININIDPSTGFVEHMKLMTKLSRLISSYELDLASYCYLFKMDVLVFINYAYTWFNYFFILIVAVEFFERILGKKNRTALNAGLVGVLFFALYPKFFDLLHITIQDGWQFNTAIWYGSSICRIPALMLLFIGLYEYENQYLKQFFYLVGWSFVLMSKGSQILPILVFAFFLYALFWLWKQKVSKIIKVIPVVLFAAASIVFDHVVSYTTSVGENINSIVEVNIKNPLILLIFVVFIILAYFNRENEKLTKWNFVLLFCAFFTYIDVFNDVLTTFSMYYFVAARATTLIFYSMVVTIAFEIVDLLAARFSVRSLTCLSLAAMLIFSGVSCVYIGKDVFKYVIDNPKLVYEPTLELSDYLNQLDQENGDDNVNVVCSTMFYHHYLISLSTSLRYYANTITVISLQIRYDCEDEGNPVSNYTEDDDQMLNDISASEPFSLEEFAKMLDQTEANTVVLESDSYDEEMNSIGYTCIHEISDCDGNIQYHVYYKN